MDCAEIRQALLDADYLAAKALNAKAKLDARRPIKPDGIMVKEFDWQGLATRLDRYKFHATCINAEDCEGLKEGETYEIELDKALMRNPFAPMYCMAVRTETDGCDFKTGNPLADRFVPWMPRPKDEAYWNGQKVVAVSACLGKVIVLDKEKTPDSVPHEVNAYDLVPARFQEGGITYYSILDKVAAAEAALKRISERPNKYPGNCSCCGTYVEDYKGYLQRRTGANGYYVWCEKCLAEMLKQAKNRKTRKTLHETVAHKDGRIKIDDIRFRKFDIIDRSLIRTDTRWSPNSTGICSACKRDMHVNADGICLSCFKMPEPSNAKAAELAAMEAKFRWGGFIDVAEYKAYYSLVSTSKMQFIG